MKFLQLTTEKEGKLFVNVNSISGVSSYKKNTSYYTVIYFDGCYMEVNETTDWILHMLKLNEKNK